MAQVKEKKRFTDLLHHLNQWRTCLTERAQVEEGRKKRNSKAQVNWLTEKAADTMKMNA